MGGGVVGLTERLGEVPKVGTDHRRSWLLALTADDLRVITRDHGQGREAFTTCWGWGAVGSGTDDGDPVRCTRCNRNRPPLWFLEPDEVGTPQKRARCWQCAAIDHLTECDLWGN